MNAIYVRVSTDEQAHSGYSLQDQISSCRNRLLSLGLTDIQEYIDDGYSGEFLERPALDRLRDDLRAKLINTVIVYDPDRLSRNLTNQLLLSDDIEKANAQLMFVTGDYDASPEGRLFFNMKGAISAYEKAKIRERTARGRRAKARSGKVVINNKPYGFDWDAQNSIYLINEEEAKVVHLIYDLCLKRNWGAPKITEELYERGIRNREGKQFNNVHVYRIMTKELYCGTAYASQISTKKIGQYKIQVTNIPAEDWIPISIPAIETRERWQQVQKVMEQNGRLSKRNTKREYLLRGILKCGICGMGMVTNKIKTTGSIHHYYRCVTKSSPQYRLNTTKCPNRYIPVDLLEESVWEAFVAIASGDAVLSDFLKAEKLPEDHTEEIAKLAKKQDEAIKLKADIMKWRRLNLIDSTTAESELQNVNKELYSINSQLTILQKSQDKLKQITVISPEEILNANTSEKKRQVLLQSNIEVHVTRLGKTPEFWFQH
jgi:site-specific DNA recombinase